MLWMMGHGWLCWRRSSGLIYGSDADGVNQLRTIDGEKGGLTTTTVVSHWDYIPKLVAGIGEGFGLTLSVCCDRLFVRLSAATMAKPPSVVSYLVFLSVESIVEIADLEDSINLL